MLEHPDDTTRDKATQGMPAWVKRFAITTAVLVVLLVVLLLTGGHGPGRHTPGGAPAPAVGETTSTDLMPA